MGLKRNTTIRQALQHVADNPVLNTDVIIDLPVHELVARTLFEIANDAHPSKPRSLSKANIARELIFNRLVGKRLPGSHPATRQKSAINFVDLTGELGK